MSLEIWLGFIGTVLILMSTPGPSHILMLSNSIQNGFRRSTATAAGDLSANFLQMAFASVGLVALIQNSREFFLVVKWLGVAYLAYLGLKLILSKRGYEFAGGKRQRSLKSLYWQGFITSAANPKAVIFFAALFPQFIDQDVALAAQFAVLSLTYLTLDGAFLCFYGKFSDLLVRRMQSSIGVYFNQISGVLLILAAFLLGIRTVDNE